MASTRATPGCSWGEEPRGSRPLSEGGPVDVGSAADPVAALLDAHAAGRLVALPTSGTTGRPRSVVRSPESWIRSFRHVVELTGMDTGSALWVPGPMSATMNLFAAALGRLLGTPLVEGPREATHAHLTPVALERALDDAAPLDGVHLTVAGDRLPGSLRLRAELTGARVSHYYGASELSFVAWGSDENDLRAFPEVEVETRNDEVWVRSPYLCEGYAGPAPARGPLRRDPDGFATVGDRGVLADGLLRVLGRGDEAVTTAGSTVLVADVEGVLLRAAQGSVVVVGVPHPALGAVLAAVLTDPADLPDLHAAAQRDLRPAQRPRLWFHVPRLPSSEVGKVDRAAVLREVIGVDAVRLVPRRARTCSP